MIPAYLHAPYNPQSMNENSFILMKVTFNHYYNDSGERIHVPGLSKGVIFGFITQNTEEGLQIVSIV